MSNQGEIAVHDVDPTEGSFAIEHLSEEESLELAACLAEIEFYEDQIRRNTENHIKLIIPEDVMQTINADFQAQIDICKEMIDQLIAPKTPQLTGLRRLISLGRGAVQERTAMPKGETTRRKAEEEDRLFGQSTDQDRRIKYGRHSLREIQTGVSDTLPLKLI